MMLPVGYGGRCLFWQSAKYKDLTAVGCLLLRSANRLSLDKSKPIKTQRLLPMLAPRTDEKSNLLRTSRHGTEEGF